MPNFLINLGRNLDLVNPTNILSRGYAIVKNKRGMVVRGSQDVKHHERIEIVLLSNNVSAIVDKNYNSQQDELI